MWPFHKKPPIESAAETKPMPLFSTHMQKKQAANALETALDNIHYHQPSLASFSAEDSNISNHAQPNIDNEPLAILPEALTGWYAAQSFIGYQLCAILSQHWLIDKACTMPARDAMRHGFSIIVHEDCNNQSAIIKDIEKLNQDFSLISQCEEFIRMGRIFGIRLALFQVESSDKDYYQKPFNPDGVTKGGYKGICQIDPQWCVPELDESAMHDPLSQNFYQPTFWRIGKRRIHHSHFIIFKNGQVPDILKPLYAYGGVPVPQRIMERVYAAERTANEAPQLAQSKRMMVWNTDLMTILTNQQRFSEHMQVFNNYQNNYGVKLVNHDDTIQQFETSLSDLDAVIATQYQIVAASANVPATKLLGTTPKGFNASGDYEEASYHEELESIQSHDILPLINRHHLLLMRSEIAPKYNIDKNTAISIDFEALDSPTAKEYAEIGEILARTDASLLATGAITAEDIAKRLCENKASAYQNIKHQ